MDKNDKQESKPSKLKHKVNFIRSRCKGCSFCVEFCPTKVFEMTREMNAKGYYVPKIKYPEKCIGCQMCSMVCPEFAMFVETEGKEKK